MRPQVFCLWGGGRVQLTQVGTLLGGDKRRVEGSQEEGEGIHQEEAEGIPQVEGEGIRQVEGEDSRRDNLDNRAGEQGEKGKWEKGQGERHATWEAR